MLTTVLTVDEFGEGVPIAFLLSNRADTSTPSFFFELVKKRIDFCLEADVFVSDAPDFFNASSKVMKPPKHHLLCVWHVDRNWQKYISQKVEGDRKFNDFVYKQVRCIMETQEQEFKNSIKQVVNHFCSQDCTKAFGNRPHLWAFCYHSGLGINTNMFLESMHKVLKHIYLEGKKSKSR